jgi:hypothetical protein
MYVCVCIYYYEIQILFVTVPVIVYSTTYNEKICDFFAAVSVAR